MADREPKGADRLCSVCGLAVNLHSQGTCEICGRPNEHHAPGDRGLELQGRSRMAHARQAAGLDLNELDRNVMRQAPQPRGWVGA